LLKTLGTQLALLFEEPQMRQNLGALFKFLGILVLAIALYTVLFHVIMFRVEGQQYSWFSGFYWTLVTMTTLGYGDITFQTDLGRIFSMIVLFSGVILLLVVLPFVFIRYFYAPWLEAQVRLRAPRKLGAEVRGHVIICGYDTLAPGLIAELEIHDIPYVVLDPDPERAGERHADGVTVVCGEVDSGETYEAVGVDRCRMVLANLDDITNTNIVLTVRELAPRARIAAIASSEDAVDVLALSGATWVLPLRRQLGEHLANRINAGHAHTHVIGHFRGLVIAEFPVMNTPLSGKTVREIGLRESMGLNVVGVWDHARFDPAQPDRKLTDQCLPVVVGTEAQMEELDELLYIYDTNWNPVIVLGGGKVGRSATRTLKRKGIPVHLVERKPELATRWKDLPDRMFVGDAANLELLEEAGIHDAPAVLLTTNDDAMNIFLTVYCRKLNPKCRIVSRLTHQRNVESIRRAGADLVLSYAGLGADTVASLARGREMVFLGQGVDLFDVDVPEGLHGKTLKESGIGARTGLNVVALEREGVTTPAAGADQALEKGSRIFLIGTQEQMQAFRREYGGD
jgi:voltage-gated potassium channel